MRATEILSERFDYQQYTGPLMRLVTDAYAQTREHGDIEDPKNMINDFLYELGEAIDEVILIPLLKSNPIVYEGVRIRSITVSFSPIFDKPMGAVKLGSISSEMQRYLRKTYPGNPLPTAGVPAITAYIKSHVNFTREARFRIDTDARSAIITIDIDGSQLANLMFLTQDPEIQKAALQTTSSGISGKLFHEIKHAMQSNKLAAKGKTDKEYNRFYTGNPKNMDKDHQYTQTKDGYWLNSEELDSWAANVASEIMNIFGEDTQGMVDYLNASSQGKTINYNGMPIDTTLAHYYREIFNPEYQMNTPRQEVWRKFIKNIYKDIQMYRKSNTWQTPPAGQ